MTEFNLSVLAPEVTKEKYAELCGVTVRTVDGWIDKGYLPAVKVGKRCLVNVAQRTLDLANHGKDA